MQSVVQGVLGGYNEVLLAARNFIKSRISLIRGFNVLAVEIISHIPRTFLVDSILSVTTYKQMRRRSGHNGVVMSASARGADRSESNGLAWITACEISVLHCAAP